MDDLEGEGGDMHAGAARKVSFQLLGSCLVILGTGCASSRSADAEPPSTASGLVYTVIQEGAGAPASSGQWVKIHETVSFLDGRVFYDTRTLGNAVRFLLGGGQVITGVEEVVLGMRVGERRQLVMPPELSRRSAYPEGLSPEDSLHYDLELVEIEGDPP